MKPKRKQTGVTGVGSSAVLGANVITEIKSMKLINEIRDALKIAREIKQTSLRELELKDAERHKKLLDENAKLKSEVVRVRKAYVATHEAISKNVTDVSLFRAIITDSVAYIEVPNAKGQP